MAIVVRFIADASKFIKGVESSISSTELFSKKSTAEFAKVTKAIGAWAAASAAAMGAAGVAMVKSGADAAKEIKNLSSVANTSVAEFQKMAFAAQTVGIEQDKFADILKDVNDRVGDFAATGGGPMKDFFDTIAPKVGVTAEQFRKLSGPQALQLYYSSLEKANLNQQDMTFYLEAMASDATALVPLLKEGGQGFANQADEAERLGIVMSDIDVERMSQLNTRFQTMGKVVEAAKNQFAAGLAPAIEGIIKLIADTVGGIGGFRDAGTSAMNAMVTVIGHVADAIHGLRVAFKAVSILGPSLFAAFTTSFEMIARGISSTIDFVIEQINTAIEFINKNPLFTIQKIDYKAADSSIVTFFRDIGDTTRGVVVQMQDELAEMAMQRLPSDALKQYVDDAIAEGDRLSAKTGQIGAGVSGRGADGDDEKLKAEQERQKQRLEIIRGALIEEEEIMAAKHASEIEQLHEHMQNKLITEQEYMDIVKAKNDEFMASIADVRKKGMTEQEKIQQMSLSSQTALVAGELGGMFNAFSSHSKKMNKAAQVLGATQALVATFVGQAESLKLGWPLGVIAAAKIGAAGLGFVSAIKSAGSGGGGSSGGTASATTAVSAPAPQQFNVALSGFNPNQGIGMNQLGDVMKLINDRIRAGETFGGFAF